ncbi:hypothetical protein O3P69_008895 [Scylla paramamosain]|uniref:RING-type domain-containing protein n=1 Tax=Scylla paramamosain TaxID=85552 RepID=A0AAW0TR42_SCYPA
MPRPLAQNVLMRPLVALALPGMYLVYKYNQYKRQQQEANRRKAAERELVQLHHKIDKLLNKLDQHEPELAMTQEEECVICVNAKATMQTFPCGHRVVCRKCFVKTIQVAVSQRLLPLRCVVCRAKILRLRQARDSPFPTSVSQYSMSAVSASGRMMPNSSSLYSFTSGSSGVSGLSNVSSASSSSGGSYRSGLREGKLSRPVTLYSSKRIPAGKKVRYTVSSKSGARSKEPLKGGLPQIRIDEYHEPACRPPPVSRPPRVHIRENKVAPQETLGRLPTIKEYTEFITEKEMEKEKSSSTRIRCAQKLVSQIEHQQGVPARSRSPRPIAFTAPSSARPSSAAAGPGTARGGRTTGGGGLQAHQMSRSPSASPSGASNTRSTPDKGRRGSASSSASLRSNASLASGASVKSSASTLSNASCMSASSVKSVASTKSVASAKSGASVKSGASAKSGASVKSGASGRSSTSTKSTCSSKSTATVKAAKGGSSLKKEPESKGVRRKEANDKKQETNEKRPKQNKGESKIKMLKKRFEGKEYMRLQ